jgi:hypothetical protein
MAKLFCLACGSDRYLVHRDGCLTWVIPVEMPAPDHQRDPEAAPKRQHPHAIEEA